MFEKYIFLLFLFKISLSVIVYPFKTAYMNKNGEIDKDSKEYNATHFLNDYYNRLLYIKLEIGNPPQEIKAILTYDDCGFKIGKANKCINETEYYSHYNRNKSSDFNYTDLFPVHISEFEDDSCSAKDTISAYTDYSLKNYVKFKDIGFYLGSDTNDELCGVIGFKMNRYSNGTCPKINNFIRSFKSNNIINNYKWILKYNSLDEGLFIIGSNMNEIIPSYDEKNLVLIYSRYIGGTYPWSFDIDEIKVGKNRRVLSGTEMWVEIENDFSLLMGNNLYQKYIEEEFFKEFFDKNICKKIECDPHYYHYKYYVIECDKEKFGSEQINNFPNISFLIRSKETEITFDSNELFTETKYKYFFNVVFSIYGGGRWVFGKLFLKKYPVMFNLDQDTFEIYNSIYGNNDPNNENLNQSFSTTILILIIIGLVTILCITAFLFYYLGKKGNALRKIKANELDDDYEYTSQKDAINNENRS